MMRIILKFVGAVLLFGVAIVVAAVLAAERQHVPPQLIKLGVYVGALCGVLSFGILLSAIRDIWRRFWQRRGLADKPNINAQWALGLSQDQLNAIVVCTVIASLCTLVSLGMFTVSGFGDKGLFFCACLVLFGALVLSGLTVMSVLDSFKEFKTRIQSEQNESTAREDVCPNCGRAIKSVVTIHWFSIWLTFLLFPLGILVAWLRGYWSKSFVCEGCGTRAEIPSSDPWQLFRR